MLKKIRPIDRKNLDNINNFDFIESGHLDSFEILKFNMFLEKKFKIKLLPKDVTSKSYKTVIGLTNIIDKKLI